MDLTSNGPHQGANTNAEDFRTLLNTSSKGSSEVTAETVRMINSEITSQVSNKIEEITLGSNVQVREAIE